MTDETVNMGTCSGCHQRIRWAYTPAGKAMPFDPDPVTAPDQGTYVLEGKHARKPEPLFDTVFHLTHYATCPKADDFRLKK